jgi:hypothetical protein
VDLMPNLPTRHHRIRHHGRFTNPIAQSQEIDVARENQLAAAERELETAIREHRAIGLAARRSALPRRLAPARRLGQRRQPLRRPRLICNQ